MKDDMEWIGVIAGIAILTLIVCFAFAWFIVLPTIGLLYVMGYLT